MTSKPVSGIRIATKDGKTVVVKKPPRMAAGQARGKSLAAARLKKKWQEKSK